MVFFEMIKYHSRTYSQHIPLRIEEVAAHLDTISVNCRSEYSLHTEYSYGKRSLKSHILEGLDELTISNKGGVPQLWRNAVWAEQFANFILRLTKNLLPPSVIEIHPPFSDYSDIKSFSKTYSIFENKILSVFPETEILIENRCGSLYRGGKFIVSKYSDLLSLCEEISTSNLKLKIALDIPQLYTAHNAKTSSEYISLMQNTVSIRDYIGGVHLWGKSFSSSGKRVAHCGDLNSYFGFDNRIKSDFLLAFYQCFDDDHIRRLVLEVNSGDSDMASIIGDLSALNIAFV